MLSTASLINVQFSLFFGVDTEMAAGKPKSKAMLAREKRRLQEWKIKTDRKYKEAIPITHFMRKSSLQKVLLRMLSKFVFHLIRLVLRLSSAGKGRSKRLLPQEESNHVVLAQSPVQQTLTKNRY